MAFSHLRREICHHFTSATLEHDIRISVISEHAFSCMRAVCIFRARAPLCLSLVVMRLPFLSRPGLGFVIASLPSRRGDSERRRDPDKQTPLPPQPFPLSVSNTRVVTGRQESSKPSHVDLESPELSATGPDHSSGGSFFPSVETSSSPARPSRSR